MKYTITNPPSRFRTTETWIYPIQTKDPSAEQAAANETLHRTLGLTLDGPVETLTPEDAVVLKEMNEARWAVYVEQKIPLREVEAIRWFAEREFKAQVRTGYTIVWPLKEKIREVAGGVLPADALPILDDIEVWAKPITDKRAKRKVHKRLEPDKPAIEGRFVSAMSPKLVDAWKAARFNNPNVRREADDSCSSRVEIRQTRKTLDPYGNVTWVYDAGFRPRIDFQNQRGRSTLVTIRVKSDWFTKVLKPGLANLFGPRTLVLDAKVNGAGTRVLLAHQSEKGRAIKVEWGWASLDKNSNRVFRPEKKGVNHE